MKFEAKNDLLKVSV